MGRSIGFWRAWALVVGTMVGSGVFLLPSVLGPYGWLGFWGWGVTTVGALFVALTIAYLAKRAPGLGGPYSYTKKAFGNLPGFLIAWGYWLSLWIGNAAIAVAFAGYAANLHPMLANGEMVIALGITLFFTFINWLGVRTAGTLGLVITIAKIMPLAAIGVLGVVFGSTDTVGNAVVAEGTSTFAAVATMAMLALWAFTGVESVTIPADDVKDPHKTIPKALITGVLTSAGLYVVACFGVMMVVSPEQLATSGAPFADAARAIMGPTGDLIVTLGALIAIAGTLNALVMMSGQLPLAAARDGLFPKSFGVLADNGVPKLGIGISTLFSFVCIYLNFQTGKAFNVAAVFQELILLSTLLILAPYVACALAACKIAVKDRQYKGLFTFIPALAFIAFAVFGNDPMVLLKGLLLFAAGLPVYWFSLRSRNGLNPLGDNQ